MEKTLESYGYCHITITSQGVEKLMKSNDERAFVITQLQDMLSPRLILGDVPAYRQLASCIDLLAFSISQSAIHLLVFTIDMTIATDFAHRIAARLRQYQTDAGWAYARIPEVHTSLELLAGPHQALVHSARIHLLHQDWEYDRYSSIGFYLHDRRGDWMRIWRLTSLYQNDSSLYNELLEARSQKHSTVPFASTEPQSLAS